MKKTKIWIGSLFIFNAFSMIIFNSCDEVGMYYNKYFINEDICTDCHICVPKCGYGAISYTKYSAVLDTITWEFVETPAVVKIDPKKCVGCGECFVACPSGAIGGTDGKTGATTSINGEDDDEFDD